MFKFRKKFKKSQEESPNTNILNNAPQNEGETTILSQEQPQSEGETTILSQESETTLFTSNPFSESETTILSQEPQGEGETTILSQEPYSEGETTILSQEPQGEGKTTILSQELQNEGETTILSQELQNEGETTILSQEPQGEGETTILSGGSGELETTLFGMGISAGEVMQAADAEIKLEITDNHSGRKQTVNKNVFLIGKDANNMDFVVDDRSVSRHHATVFFENGSYFIMDNKSTNGTTMEGVALSPFEKAELYDGSIISLGNVGLQIKMERR